MKRTVVLSQTKMLIIASPGWTAMGHGFCDNIPGKEWYRGEFTSQAEADAIFADVKRRFQIEEASKGSWMEDPKMTIEWVTTSTKTIPE